jgi:hypothetical protein
VAPNGTHQVGAAVDLTSDQAGGVGSSAWPALKAEQASSGPPSRHALRSPRSARSRRARLRDCGREAERSPGRRERERVIDRARSIPAVAPNETAKCTERNALTAPSATKRAPTRRRRALLVRTTCERHRRSSARYRYARDKRARRGQQFRGVRAASACSAVREAAAVKDCVRGEAVRPTEGLDQAASPHRHRGVTHRSRLWWISQYPAFLDLRTGLSPSARGQVPRRRCVPRRARATRAEGRA